MNLHPFKPLVFSAAAFFAGGVYPALAQTAPAASSAKEQESTAVKLDPFNVSADSDVGFVAASSLAGGRIASALKDTPVAYSVITKEFLDAFNVQDIVEAAQWSTNANIVEGDNGTRMYGYSASNFVRQRGIKMGLPSQNYFTTTGTQDSYNVDRVDMARGPNSAVFGAGGVGGTMNSLTKQAEVSKSITEFQVRLGAYDHYRFTTDINRAINAKFAIRINALYDDGGSWRDNFFTTRTGVTVALKYVVTPKFNIRTELGVNNNMDGSISVSMRDQISAWDGKTTFATYGLRNASITMSAVDAAKAGLSAAEPQRFVESSDWGHVYMNFQNRYQTKGAAQNAAATNYINGRPINTVGMSLNNTAWADDMIGMPSDRWTPAMGGSPFMRLPRSEDTWLWTNHSLPGAVARAKNASLFFTYTPTESLYFEVAGNVTGSKQFGENTQRRGLLDTKLEINRDLPDGSPNPGFLKPYIDVMTYRVHKDYTLSQLRAQMVYQKNFNRIGSLKFSALTGYNFNRQYAWSASVLLPLTSLAPDARTWTDVSEQSEYGAWTRWYVTDGSPRIWYDNNEVARTVYNPTSGVRESVKPRAIIDLRKPDNNYLSRQQTRFGQASVNFDTLKNHLIFTGAFRRDLTNLEIQRVLPAGGAPAGWDGYQSAALYAPPAPADFYSLTFLPKDPSGRVIGPAQNATTRPRGRPVTNNSAPGDHANIALPQYAGDRFQDDFSTPKVNTGVNTWTYGTVVNLFKGIGLYANKSTTFNFSPPGQRVDGSVVPPTSANGTDYGIRLTLPNNRLYITVGRFKSYQDGATIRVSPGTNNIALLPLAGVLNNSDINIRGFKQVPTDTYSTYANGSSGYEVEATANLTRNWRLTANVGYTDATIQDSSLDIIKFFQDNDAIMRQVLADGGIIINSGKQAAINPALNDPTKINQTKADLAVTTWNNIQNTTLPNLLNTGVRIQPGNTQWIYNFATDYRFTAGPLRGLRVGTGVQYRGGAAIGYKASDTIRDPNNPALAIDDPTVDGNTTLFAPSSIKWTGTLSYTVRLKDSGRYRPKTIQFDLNVENLANNRNVIYSSINDVVQTSNTFLRPRVGEDFTSPARRTVPGTFNYFPPRNVTLSAKFNF